MPAPIRFGSRESSSPGRIVARRGSGSRVVVGAGLTSAELGGGVGSDPELTDASCRAAPGVVRIVAGSLVLSISRALWFGSASRGGIAKTITGFGGRLAVCDDAGDVVSEARPRAGLTHECA